MIEIEVNSEILAEIVGSIRQNAQAAVVETTREMQAAISANTPYGKLRRSLRRRTRGAVGEISGVWWWYFPEYGTRTQAARPAVTPARMAAEKNLAARLRKAFRP